MKFISLVPVLAICATPITATTWGFNFFDNPNQSGTQHNLLAGDGCVNFLYNGDNFRNKIQSMRVAGPVGSVCAFFNNDNCDTGSAGPFYVTVPSSGTAILNSIPPKWNKQLNSVGCLNK